ncbi:MAG TPA: DNA mismatch repair protein MutS [Nitrospirota bacterium]|nr:DNA mismatch repair protein MutS [Nitrospirota bacterium]
MKAFLMYKDRDFDAKRELPWNAQALTQDLELNTLFDAMALGDKFLLEVARKAVFLSATDPDAIRYRQDILKDCLKNSSTVKEIYNLVVQTLEGEKKVYWGFFTKYPAGILSDSISVMQFFVTMLKQLRAIADDHGQKFDSAGFTTLFTMLKKELTDEYFAGIQDHLRELKFRDGVLISAGLGKGTKGINYILRKSREKEQSKWDRFVAEYLLPRLQDNEHPWLKRLFAHKTPAYTFYLHPRDEAGARALGELRDRGIHLVANALAQSSDHIRGFFMILRTELAFYIGCLNLHEQLSRMGEPLCFPIPLSLEEREHSLRGLYDVCLALKMKRRIVGNDMRAGDKKLVIVTGANQGGKSTFLRSIGLAQLMMQCGMFVPAESLSANVCDGLFTHYKREEDVAMKSGKLDEELSRMSDIVDKMTPNPVILFNESFAATNEREGSELASQIVSALLEKGIKIFFVTHLYTLARGFHDKKPGNAVFLRAERQADGRRTFKLIEGEPLQTSFGADVYKAIFGNAS